MGLDERSAYDKERRKEYKTIIRSHYELLKDEKRKRMGGSGGRSTQQGIRDVKKELSETKEGYIAGYLQQWTYSLATPSVCQFDVSSPNLQDLPLKLFWTSM